MTDPVSISVLGELSVSVGGEAAPLPASRKTRALLAYCVLTGRPHRRERLCELFWDVPDDPRAALRWSLSKLRPVLNGDGRERLVADRDRVAVDLSDIAVDLLQIRARLRESAEPPALADLRAMASRLELPLLEGLDLPRLGDFQGWLVAEREDTRLLLFDVLDRLAAHTGLRAGEAAKWARRRIVADPSSEAVPGAVGARRVAAQSRATAPSTRPDFDEAKDRRPSVAVLPFDVAGEEADARLLALGLTRDVTHGLARTRWLFVSSNASAGRFAGAAHDPRAVGAALGVRHLLHGTMDQVGRRIRLSIALSDAATGAETWAERFDAELDDLFEIRDQISSGVVAAVEGEIEVQERRRAVLAPIASLDAWGAYHAATDLLGRYRPEHFPQAEELLTRAAALDPNSSRIFAARSFLAWQRAFLNLADRDTSLARARDFAQHAVWLDPLDPQAQWSLGRASQLGGDLEGAVEQFELSVCLNPSFARGQYNLAWGMLMKNQPERGLARIDEARRLSPFDPMAFSFMGVKSALHFAQGDLDAAKEWARRSARQPNSHHHNIMNCALMLREAGARDEALALARQVLDSRPGYGAAEFLRTAMLPHDRQDSILAGLRDLGIG